MYSYEKEGMHQVQIAKKMDPTLSPKEQFEPLTTLDTPLTTLDTHAENFNSH